MNDKPKIYVPGSAKLVNFTSGKSVLKISFNAKKLIAFINEHANSAGYMNIDLVERKSVGQYGDTHCMILDTWEPKKKEEPPPLQPAAKPADDSEDLPF